MGQLQTLPTANNSRLNGRIATVTGRSLSYLIRQFVPIFPAHRRFRCPDIELCYRALRVPGAAVQLLGSWCADRLVWLSSAAENAFHRTLDLDRFLPPTTPRCAHTAESTDGAIRESDWGKGNSTNSVPPPQSSVRLNALFGR